MKLLPRPQWTPAQTLGVARLICDPATNGGTESPLTPEQVATTLPDSPALAAFADERAVFVVGLWPYDPAIPRGVLHVAGTGELRGAWQVVRGFMDALPGVDILTMSNSPALTLLARRAGLVEWYEQAGYTVLRRATPGGASAEYQAMKYAPHIHVKEGD